MRTYGFATVCVVVLSILALAWLMGGCTVPPGHDPAGGARTVGMLKHEVPPPDGPWRPHELGRCGGADGAMPTQAGMDVVALALELFQLGEGGDAVLELELHVAEKTRVDGLVLLTLSQLYVLAAQGKPTVEPGEGPAAMSGDWISDRPRLVARAEEVLRRAAEQRPDDSAVDYLLADAARCRHDMTIADALFELGKTKCSSPEGMAVLIRYQELNPHPARQLKGVDLDYPAAAARDGVSGEVVMDLLIAPSGQVVQVTIVAEPDRRLGNAAAAAMEKAGFSAGRIGKYPVWSWTRVTVAFS